MTTFGVRLRRPGREPAVDLALAGSTVTDVRETYPQPGSSGAGAAGAARRGARQAGPDGPAEGAPPGDRPPWWRRLRVPLIATLVALLALLVLALAHSRSVRGQLDPRAANPDGSRALAALLSDRNVTVRRVTQLSDAIDGVGERSIVFIPFPNLLPTAELRRVGDLGTGQVVVIAPTAARLAALTDGVRLARNTSVSSHSPDCAEAGPTAAGSADTGGAAYRVVSGTGCYPGGGGHTLAISRTHGEAQLAVLGSGEFLTNDRLDQNGNAALGLNLLGADGSADEVRWLVPAPSAATTDDQVSLSDLLPDWVGLAALQLLIAALLAALWRARRLGPPVTEPLPVVVRSAEAVEGRARLYRRAQARDRAAEALRAGARARLVPRLGLGRDAGGEPEPGAVTEVVADWTGRSEAGVMAALYGPPPPDDAALVALADTLDSIVRETLDPEVRRP
jgi:hypothetical protein